MECPNCGMPVKTEAKHCSSCGEYLTTSLTTAYKPQPKRTPNIDLATDAPAAMGRVMTEGIPATTRLSKTSLDHSCQRCGVALTVGAKFCLNCGRAVEPTAAERALANAKQLPGRLAGFFKRAVGDAPSRVKAQMKEQAQTKGKAGLVANGLLGLAALALLYSFFTYPTLSNDPNNVILSKQLASLWWLGVSLLLAITSLTLKK